MDKKFSKFLIAIIFVGILTIGLVGCGEDNNLANSDGNKDDATSTKVKEVTTDKKEVVLYTISGQSNYRLQVTIVPENATDKTLHFSSSNNKVATVDNDGLVNAISVGDATITVICTNDKSCSIKIHVLERPADEIAVKDVKLKITDSHFLNYDEVNKKYDVIYFNSKNEGLTKFTEDLTLNLSSEIIPKDATNKNIEYYTDKKELVHIDKNGKISFEPNIKTGTEIIVGVKTIDGNIKKEYKLKIHNIHFVDFNSKTLMHSLPTKKFQSFTMCLDNFNPNIEIKIIEGTEYAEILESVDGYYIGSKFVFTLKRKITQENPVTVKIRITDTMSSANRDYEFIIN